MNGFTSRNRSVGRESSSRRTTHFNHLIIAATICLCSSIAAGQAVSLHEAQQRAAQQVLVSARSSRADIRANAIEAAEALSNRREALCQLALTDADPVVRFAALTVIGKLQLSSVAPGARTLLDDQHESVRAAAIFALARCFGTDRRTSPYAADVSPLAGMLGSDNPTTRANVAMLVGLMGDSSAVPVIKDMAARRMTRANPTRATITRIQMAEAAVVLGDLDSLDPIRAGAFSQFEEVRVLSVMILGRLKDKQFEPAFVKLLDNPPIELQLAAAGTLARFGRADGLTLTLNAAASDSITIRAQAAYTLGLFRGNPQAIDRMAAMLSDSSEQVRIAAAAALLGGGRDGL